MADIVEGQATRRGKREEGDIRMPADTPEHVHQLWTQAFREGDMDALAALYEQGATLVHQPGEEPVRGTEAIREALITAYFPCSWGSRSSSCASVRPSRRATTGRCCSPSGR